MMKNKTKQNDELINKIVNLLTEKKDNLRLLDISKKFKFKSNTNEYEELRNTLNTLYQQGVISKSSRRRYSIVAKSNKKDINVVTKSVEKPTQKVGKPTQKVEKPTQKGEKPTQKVEKPTQKVEKPTQKVEKPTQKVGKPTQKGEKPTQKGGKPTTNKHFTKINKVNTESNKMALKGYSHLENEYNQIVKEYNLPSKFPSGAINEANNFRSPDNNIPFDRIDFTGEEVITIDPVSARDFDDALSLKRLDDGNYSLGIHIADVSYYVGENSKLDKEAFKRGNSVYLADKVVPMLPEVLSNEICSLNPYQLRYTYSVLFIINEGLNIVNYSVIPSVIRSCRRFSYDEVQTIIDTGEGDKKELVLELHSLASKFRAERIKNGSINYDTKEIKYVLDDKLCPVDVEIHTTTDATALVEEFMLLANKQVALHLKKLSKRYKIDLPFIYRIHDKPREEAIKIALEQLKSLGVKFKTIKNVSKLLNKILSEVKGTAENDVVNQILIRSMAKAVYSAENIGHFGLGFDNYTHFTSPIRRYSDLIVHRLLREYGNDVPATRRINKLRKDLIHIADYVSNTERTAMDAERASTKLASVIYAKELVGSVFEGSVSGVLSYGIFVMLDEIYVEGFIHRKELPKDDYKYDEQKVRLFGRKNKTIYAFGTKVKVRIIRADINKRQIDLMIEED
ncbi:MAG: VacB/RNase II family 3'-5' exoribonuclease [Bacteroidetes bacterium]|nr:VacB/RNase II family 3'-5' exoribonuclease [Bacteroidota bacterium]